MEPRLHVHTVEQEAGAGIKELAQLIHRPTCSTCGTIKRYQFNRVAIEQQYDVMATGHNLDDEAARLLGNVLHWQEEYLDKQGPSLPASVEGFAKKVKPLYRLSERELAAYAVLNRIDYIVEECPMAKGSQDAPVQGSLESPGDRVARHETDVLLGFSREAKQEAAHCDHHDGERPGRPPSLHLLQPAHHRRDLFLLQDDGAGENRRSTLTGIPTSKPCPSSVLEKPRSTP